MEGYAAPPAVTAAMVARSKGLAGPRFSPDGRLLAWVETMAGRSDIVVVPTDASAWPARLSTGADWAFDPAWAPDGRSVAWHEWDFPDMPWDASRIVLRAVDGLVAAGPPRVVAGGAGVNGGRVACGQPRFSPADGSLAFVCDRTGWMNVWVGD